MDAVELLTTTRALRRYSDEPIDDDTVAEIIRIATHAPSGSNAQSWRFVVVRDQAKRAAIGDLYGDVWRQFRTMYGSPEDPTLRRVLNAADHLGEHMGEAPILIVPCYLGSADGQPLGVRIGFYGSIFPAVWSILLAAHTFGLGGAITTVHAFQEERFRAILGIPDTVEPVAVVPLGHPTGKFGVPPRRPAEEVTYWDGWQQKR